MSGKDIQATVLAFSFSDHKLIFYCHDFKFDKNTIRFIELEYLTGISNMINAIQTSKLFEILNTDDKITGPTISYDLFIKTILELKNKFIP